MYTDWTLFTSHFRGRSVLVTGGAGFVGSNLVKRLLMVGTSHVHIVDNLLSSERRNIPEHKHVEFSHSSVADDQFLRSLKDKYDTIFHLCTFHGNINSIHDPLADHENNTLTTLKLYERIKDFKKLKKVVYSGAGCAVSEKTYEKATATTETDSVSLWADSPYSMSKIFGEFYSNYYVDRHGLPVVRARFQNVYGPGEILGAGQWRGTQASVWRNVVPTFIYKSLQQEALPVENKGASTRDFIYVDDIVEGLMKLAIKGKVGGAYNLATAQETSILDLAKLINRLTGNNTPLQYLPRRHWDKSGRRYGSTIKAFDDIGFEARVGLEEGMIDTIKWTKKNLSWINRCITRHVEQGHIQEFRSLPACTA